MCSREARGSRGRLFLVACAPCWTCPPVAASWRPCSRARSLAPRRWRPWPPAGRCWSAARGPATGPRCWPIAGADVLATGPGPAGHRLWTDVLSSDAVSAVREYPDRVLFLCWPPFDDDLASYTALRAYRADVLAYVGDEPGGRDRDRAVPPGARAELERCRAGGAAELAGPPKPAGGVPEEPVAPGTRRARSLPGMQALPANGSAGRRDRCFTRHPPAMALQVNGHRVEYPPDVVAAMPEGLRRAFELSPSLLWPLTAT